MSLKPINDILNVLQRQAKWQEQPFQRLLNCWAEIVGSVAATHTRPLSIQRDVLQVATSSAAWAQNLTFSRQTLLLKINNKLSTSLVDIRFSTAQWRSFPDVSKQQPIILPKDHPSYLGDISTSSSDVSSASVDADTAFDYWANRVQRRSQNLPLCPQCNCPTPPGELQRWQVCSFCAAKLMRD